MRCALVGLACLLPSCEKSKDATPESAVREMILSTRMGNAKRAYGLLAAQTQRRLQEMARLATAQTGGQRTIAPHELLAAGLDPVPHGLGEVEVLQQTGGRARVRLVSRDGKSKEELSLVRVKNRWRIVLPERVFEAESPASAPASAPAPHM